MTGDPPAKRGTIVTGASSGIGAATSVALGRLGWSVAIGARREDRLAQVAKQIEQGGGRAFAHYLDVSEPESIESFYTAAEAELGPVDVLINNAGMSRLYLLQNALVEDLQYEIAVNLLGPILMSRRAVGSMLERGEGDIVFVTSENAIHPRPYQTGYTASKAGVEAAASVLEMELEGTGVRSTIVRVGPTGTEFGSNYDHALLKDVLASWKYWGVQRHLHWIPAESVARAIVNVVTTPVEESHTSLVQVMPGGHRKESSGP